MEKPDQEVADKIIQEFREKQVLSEAGIKKIGLELSKGTMQAEDWRLLFETDRMEKVANDADKSQ